MIHGNACFVYFNKIWDIPPCNDGNIGWGAHAISCIDWFNTYHN